MKKSASPPIMILLDILFIFLFILILNQKKTVKVIIPPNHLFQGAKVVCQNSHGINMLHTEYGWQNYIPKADSTDLRFKCKKQCQELDYIKNFCKNNQAYIYIPDNIHSFIGKISYFINRNQNGMDIILFIKKDGTIDKKKLIKDYPFLKNYFYL